MKKIIFKNREYSFSFSKEKEYLKITPLFKKNYIEIDILYIIFKEEGITENTENIENYFLKLVRKQDRFYLSLYDKASKKLSCFLLIKNNKIYQFEFSQTEKIALLFFFKEVVISPPEYIYIV